LATFVCDNASDNVSETSVLALATLGDVTQIGSFLIGQGKYIRRDIVGVNVRDIALNVANVNLALASQLR
jgi:hypothetical protein